MPKKTRKQNPENSQGDNSAKQILQIIQQHSNEITRTKNRFLKEGNSEQYLAYANIEAAFDILKDDLKEEGFICG